MSPIDASATTIPLKDDAGYRNILTYLDARTWQVIHNFFGPEMSMELYKAVLYLRVLGRQHYSKRTADTWAVRSRLVNTAFFDPETYEAKSSQTRVAAAIAWAIVTSAGKGNPDEPPTPVKAVAFCLATPMKGAAS